jgi:hypothetical protein
MPDDLWEDFPGVAPDAALHGHVAFEADAAQRLEGPREVRVTRPRLNAVAVGEVDVGILVISRFTWRQIARA